MIFHILIVDDEAHVVETLAFLLKERAEIDCQVYAAYSGAEALAIARENRLDLLITDMRMPGMSGLELLEEVARLQPECQTVVLTGYSDFQSVYSAVQLNVAGYLLKNEDDEKILSTLRWVLDNIESRSPRREAPSPPSAPSGDYTVQFVRRYVQEHLAEDLSIGALAKAADYNEDYLARLFKQSAGVTIGKYVADERLRLIRRELLDDSHSLDDICREAGFSSRSYFNRFVKLNTGMSPRHLRLALKEEKA